jgi:hypothetical protein
MQCADCGKQQPHDNVRFCGGCGFAFQSPSTRLAVNRAPTSLRTPAADVVSTPPAVAVTAHVEVRSGSACPRCFSTIYYKKYAFMHFVIALCFFPIGLLAFLTPIRVCERRHKYGLGRWVIGIADVICTLALLTVFVGCYVYLHHPGHN